MADLPDLKPPRAFAGVERRQASDDRLSLVYLLVTDKMLAAIARQEPACRSACSAGRQAPITRQMAGVWIRAMTGLVNFDHIKAALELRDFDSAKARQPMTPAPRGWQKRDSPPALAAVMILIFADERQRLKLVLTLRNAELRGHSGQVSFPGGRQDPGDASLTGAALRETYEEIGIHSDSLQILGELPSIYIPTSHYEVFPTVARIEGLPVFSPNPAEVAEVFCFGLDELLRPEYKHVEQRRIRGLEARVPYYAVRDQKVWGATAIMLSEFEGRLRRVLPPGALPVMAAAKS